MKAKLISESLYKFEKKSNPLTSLGIGKEIVIKKWLNNKAIYYYVLNDDLSIDTPEGIYLNYIDIVKFPDYIKFNHVFGSFNCNNCDLVSLKGCPDIVEDNFNCSQNYLTSLEGCPKKVKGNFYMKGNNGVKFTEEDIRKVCNVSYAVVV